MHTYTYGRHGRFTGKYKVTKIWYITILGWRIDLFSRRLK